MSKIQKFYFLNFLFHAIFINIDQSLLHRDNTFSLVAVASHMLLSSGLIGSIAETPVPTVNSPLSWRCCRCCPSNAQCLAPRRTGYACGGHCWSCWCFSSHCPNRSCSPCPVFSGPMLPSRKMKYSKRFFHQLHSVLKFHFHGFPQYQKIKFGFSLVLILTCDNLFLLKQFNSHKRVHFLPYYSWVVLIYSNS